MKITPKNWREFQHYKDRNPPWIRLHKGLLDNFEYQCLPVASRALAPMLWLLASDHVDGVIDAEPKRLAFRLRCSVEEIVAALNPLIQAGFFVVEQDASGVLAGCLQPAVPETEALQRTETEAETTQKPPRAARKSDDEFSPPAWIPPELWAAYLKTRTKKRSDNNAHALRLIVRELEDLQSKGQDPVKVLENSVVNGWAGVFPVKSHGARASPSSSSTDTTAEAARLLGFTDGDVVDA